jgi:hypothetical protein
MSDLVKLRVLPTIGKNGSIWVRDRGEMGAGSTFAVDRAMGDRLIREGWAEEVKPLRRRPTGRAR